jgi:hypothetical protein
VRWIQAESAEHAAQASGRVVADLADSMLTG